MARNMGATEDTSEGSGAVVGNNKSVGSNTVACEIAFVDSSLVVAFPCLKF